VLRAPDETRDQATDDLDAAVAGDPVRLTCTGSDSPPGPTDDEDAGMTRWRRDG
jgi:hypothetical protein